MELRRTEYSVGDGIIRRPRGISPECMNRQTKSFGEQRAFASDLAVADHAHHALVREGDAKVGPPALALVVDELPKFLGVKKYPEHGEFGQGALEYTARVGQWDVAVDKRGKEYVFYAGKERMYPANGRGVVPDARPIHTVPDILMKRITSAPGACRSSSA